MTEKERRKEIRQRKEARSRVLRLRCLVFFVILGLAAAAVLSGLTRNRGQAAAEKEMSVQVPDMPEEVNTEPVPEMLDLTGDIRKQGDLILVNAGHAYDFEANSGLALVRIREAQTYDYPTDKESFEAAEKIMPALDAMIRACDEAMGTRETSISSAYRTEEYQRNVVQETAELYGEDYAAKYAAKPGYSEHHTGLAVDLGITYADGEAGSFSESPNAVWMAEHCHEYGFVRRYAEDKQQITGISNEAWHFRYVGKPHAAYMKEHNLCLEEYLDYLKENTEENQPLFIRMGTETFKVWYTVAETIIKPEGDYAISGDNAGGVVITAKT